MKRSVEFIHTLLPILFLRALIVAWLICGQLVLDVTAAPLEVIFIFASAFAVADVRFSIGLEHPHDLIQDLDTALSEM